MEQKKGLARLKASVAKAIDWKGNWKWRFTYVGE